MWGRGKRETRETMQNRENQLHPHLYIWLKRVILENETNEKLGRSGTAEEAIFCSIIDY
jgi:hypothetical protein